MTTAEIFEAKGISKGCLEFYDLKTLSNSMYKQCIRDSAIQINHETRGTLGI